MSLCGQWALLMITLHEEVCLKRTINLISGGTPGLVNDMRIVSAVLAQNYTVSVYSSRRRNLHLPLTRLGKALSQRCGKEDDLNIFSERMPSNWHLLGRKNVLMPNQEWMREDVLSKIHLCDQIFCKTVEAFDIFSGKGYDSRFIGFTSLDRFCPKFRRDYSRFIHIAGNNGLKGTKAVLQVWQKNPNFPVIDIVHRSKELSCYRCANINIINSHLSERALLRLINEAGVHVCPSEVEGFGHSISEALSAGAIVITTDAPPMNEFVQSDFGFVASYARKMPMGFGHRYIVSEESLEECVSAVLALSLEKRIEMGERARKSFLERKLRFEKALGDAVGDLYC